jgi:opacity protein-like surface antigen
MQKYTMSLIVSIILLLAGSANAGQTSASNIYVGPLLGASVVNNSGGTNTTYGLTGGYNFNSQWGVGIDLAFSNFTVPSPLTANLTTGMITAKYLFTDVQGLFVDLGVGAGTVSVSGTGAAPASTNFTFGPGIGYDYAVSSSWSLGAEGNVLWINNTKPGVNIIQVLVDAKYWF